MINKTVPPEKLRSAVEELAKVIMSKPPIAIRLAKELINSSIETDQGTGLVHEAEAFGILSSTEDYREGVSAFIEKRKPEYEGK